MLSMLLLCRFSAEADVLSLKSSSMVTAGECNSSISFSFCVSVTSRRVEEFRGVTGRCATWTKGGGRDKTVLIGRVVTLAVTGRALLRLGASCLMKGEISEKTSVEKKE